jgi:hypothetical protein
MQIHAHVHDDHCLLSVSGVVGTVDVARLRGEIMDVLRRAGDLLLDMRQAGPVSDHLRPALAAATARARDQDRRVIVIDNALGATAACLRRQGMHLRIPIYRDPETALGSLREGRDAVPRRWVRSGGGGVPDGHRDPSGHVVSGADRGAVAPRARGDVSTSPQGRRA